MTILKLDCDIDGWSRAVTASGRLVTAPFDWTDQQPVSVNVILDVMSSVYTNDWTVATKRHGRYVYQTKESYL